MARPLEKIGPYAYDRYVTVRTYNLKLAIATVSSITGKQ